MGKYIGESVLRKEDPRLVTWEAKYLEDIKLSGMVHAVVKRSDYAHAKIKKIDTSAAEKMPGVLGVWTGKDFEELNPMPCAWQAGGITNNANTPRVLEIDKVTFTGQGVAVVVAENRSIAEDASIHTLKETGDEFDQITVNRNMKELKGYSQSFHKFANEAQILQQRIESLYEDSLAGLILTF